MTFTLPKNVQSWVDSLDEAQLMLLEETVKQHRRFLRYSKVIETHLSRIVQVLDAEVRRLLEHPEKTSSSFALFPEQAIPAQVAQKYGPLQNLLRQLEQRHGVVFELAHSTYNSAFSTFSDTLVIVRRDQSQASLDDLLETSTAASA